MTLSDSIGHVHPDCELVVFNAYKSWLAKCLNAKTQLSAPPPPLPEYGVLEAPWEVQWDNVAKAYCFFLRELGFAQWDVPVASVNGWFYGQTSSGWCWRELTTHSTADQPPPLVQEPWLARWHVCEEQFYFENPEGEQTYLLPPTVPAGWRARWCGDNEKLWCLHEGTGRTFWELDVPLLQSQYLLGVGDLFCADVRRAFRRAALRLHPDKGCDLLVWQEALNCFERVINLMVAISTKCSFVDHAGI